jgi:DNA polymerase-3 subunit gamma/tau
LAPDEYAALTMVLLRLLAFKPAAAAGAEKKTLNEPAGAAAAAAAPAASAVRPVRAEEPAAAPAAARASAPVRASADADADGNTSAPALAAESMQPPGGQRLPVVDAPTLKTAPAPRPAPDGAAAPARLMAIPVRVQPPPGAREIATPAVAAPIAASEEGDFWHATVTQLVAAEAVAALARELALQSQLVARDVDQWLLRVERESLNQASSREKLQAALAGLGHGVKIAIEIGAVVDSPARRNRQAAEERQRRAEEAIHNDPEVQSMIRDWDARIVPGTLRPA